MQHNRGLFTVGNSFGKSTRRILNHFFKELVVPSVFPSVIRCHFPVDL